MGVACYPGNKNNNSVRNVFVDLRNQIKAFICLLVRPLMVFMSSSRQSPDLVVGMNIIIYNFFKILLFE